MQMVQHFLLQSQFEVMIKPLCKHELGDLIQYSVTAADFPSLIRPVPA